MPPPEEGKEEHEDEYSESEEEGLNRRAFESVLGCNRDGKTMHRDYYSKLSHKRRSGREKNISETRHEQIVEEERQMFTISPYLHHAEFEAFFLADEPIDQLSHGTHEGRF